VAFLKKRREDNKFNANEACYTIKMFVVIVNHGGHVVCTSAQGSGKNTLHLYTCSVVFRRLCDRLINSTRRLHSRFEVLTVVLMKFIVF
jgi:hypothetical protein